MPTPTETAQAIRAAALINEDALDSVNAQVDVHMLEVAAWPNSPSKGAMRDQLNRLRGCYDSAAKCVRRTSSMATNVIAMFGSDPGPDPVPGSTTWSTGDW